MNRSLLVTLLSILLSTRLLGNTGMIGGSESGDTSKILILYYDPDNDILNDNKLESKLIQRLQSEQKFIRLFDVRSTKMHNSDIPSLFEDLNSETPLNVYGPPRYRAVFVLFGLYFMPVAPRYQVQESWQNRLGGAQDADENIDELFESYVANGFDRVYNSANNDVREYLSVKWHWRGGITEAFRIAKNYQNINDSAQSWLVSNFMTSVDSVEDPDEIKACLDTAKIQARFMTGRNRNSLNELIQKLNTRLPQAKEEWANKQHQAFVRDFLEKKHTYTKYDIKGFRNLKWGESFSEAKKKLEDKDFVEERYFATQVVPNLVFQDKFAGLDAKFVLYFGRSSVHEDGELISVNVRLRYLGDEDGFKMIQDLLTYLNTKYGPSLPGGFNYTVGSARWEGKSGSLELDSNGDGLITIHFFSSVLSK